MKFSMWRALLSGALLLCVGLRALWFDDEGRPSGLQRILALNWSKPLDRNVTLSLGSVERTAKGSHFSGCTEVGKRRAVFLSITGLRERLLLNSTLDNVVRTLVGDGFAVHVYMSLVDKPRAKAGWLRFRTLASEPSWFANLSSAELYLRLAAAVRGAGGCLAFCSIYNSSEDLPNMTGEIWDWWLWQYKPRLTDVGRSLIRLWKARQQLWRQGTIVERKIQKNYSLALWVRDDTHWADRLLNVTPLLAMPGSEKTLWSKDCMFWSGVNDKVVLLGRQAAPALFGLYDSYVKHVPVPRKGAYNSERYIKNAAEFHKLKLRTLTHEQVPSGDAMYTGGEKPYCFLFAYWCGRNDTIERFAGKDSTICEWQFPKMAAEIQEENRLIRERNKRAKLSLALKTGSIHR